MSLSCEEFRSRILLKLSEWEVRTWPCWLVRLTSSTSSGRARRTVGGAVPGVRSCPVVRPVSTNLSPAQRRPSLLDTQLLPPGQQQLINFLLLFSIYLYFQCYICIPNVLRFKGKYTIPYHYFTSQSDQEVPNINN